ncbi:MAG: nucleotide exchange factor GrpE [bacterium]|nr:nucleotide exchange factor GrpE [bacterium]
MSDEKDTDLTENFSGQGEPTPKQRVLGDPAEMVEKGEDFSSESDLVEEAGQLLDTPDELKAKVAELEDKLLRMAAEHDNYRKRMARQQDELIRAANDRVFSELLEVMDNFERALQHAKEDASPNAVLTGTEMIYGQLISLLTKHGITPIEAIGKPFDPQLHEAMMQTSSDEYPEGTVALEMGKGYQQGSRVIRHSKVGVSKGKG